MYIHVCSDAYYNYTQAREQTSARKAICKLKVKTYKLPKVCGVLMCKHACGVRKPSAMILRIVLTWF